MVFNNNLLLGAAGQGGGGADTGDAIANSIRFNDNDSPNLTFTPSGAATSTKTKSHSFWIKRCNLGTTQGILAGEASISDFEAIFLNSSNQLEYQVQINGGSSYGMRSDMVFRDPIAWYHCLIVIDTTESVSTDRQKMFVNGTQVSTTLIYSGALPLNADLETLNQGTPLTIGEFSGGYLDAYLADFITVDGQALTTTDFGRYSTTQTNVWVPITYIGTYGNNGFHLDFAVAPGTGNGAGTDTSGNGNNFTESGLAANDQSSDTPTDVHLNFSTIAVSNANTIGTLSNGNMVGTLAGSGTSKQTLYGSLSVSGGKFYVELEETGSGLYPIVGITRGPLEWNSAGAVAQGVSYFYNGNLQADGGAAGAFGASFGAGDRIGIALDAENGKAWFSKAGVWQASGDPAAGTNPAYTFTPGEQMTVQIGTGGGSTSTITLYVESDDWSASAPTGFNVWSQANLPNIVTDLNGVDKPYEYFAATLYEGNGQNQRVGDFVPFTDTFTVTNSAMFDDGDRRYLARTYTAGDAARSSNSQATISFWIKYCRAAGTDQYILSSANSAQTQRFMLYINEQPGEDQIIINMNPGPKLFKVPNGLLSEQEWSNVVVNVDVDNATAADKIKMWVNGVQATSSDTSYQTASNANYFLFADQEHFVGNLAPASAGYTGFCLNSYLAELNVLDGQLKPPTDFGQVDTSTNRWIPKDYNANVGTYGNRGFYMEFLNPTGTGNGVGTDTSGNGFNFTESFVSGGSAWATSDQFIDTPSKNYATFDSGRAGSGVVLAEGNLKQTAVTDHNVQATMPIPESGKWAFTANIDALDYSFGIVSEQNSLITKVGRTATSWGIIDTGGGGSFQVEHNSVIGFSASQPSVNNKLIAAIDMDTNSLWLGYDTGSGFTYFGGGNPATGATPTYQGVLVSGQRLYFAVGRQLSVSFGGQSTSLYGTLPTGFLELNQDNLDDTASKITAWAWIKNRDSTDSHILVDRVRGVGEVIHSNENAVETTEPNTVQRFLQRGVQVGSDVQVNTANESYVLWQWLIGNSATTGTVNNDGSIASTLIAADADHLSMVKYTGSGANATVGHGLGAAPTMVLISSLTTPANWIVWHEGLTSAQYFLNLNLTIAEFDNGAAGYFRGTAPDATVITLNGSTYNVLNEDFIAYCFRSVPGVCKVGSYTGNGNANGPYISTGFKPSFIMIKRSVGGTGNWNILDTSREPFNAANPLVLRANLTNADEAGSIGDFDILSDGFKLKAVSANANTASSTYIYIAMGESAIGGGIPFPNAR